MLSLISQQWWMFLVRGVAAIVFGVLAIVWPGPTIAVLTMLFGAYVMVDGIAMLVALARGDALARRHAWAVGAMGVLGIVAGIVTFAWPGLTAVSLLSLVALWAIAMGTMQVVAAITLRRAIDGEVWMILGGIASIAFGVLLIAFPGEGLIALTWLVAIWAIVFGVSNLSIAQRLRGLDHALARTTSVA